MKAILTYHSVDASGSVISIEKKAFAAHVSWLASGAVDVVPLENILDTPDDRDAIAITFDDGFRNFVESAWPLLHEHGLPATVFVVSGRVGHTNDWCGRDRPPVPKMPLANWDMLGRVAEQGAAIGCHTQTHRNLTDATDEQLTDEIEGAARVVEQRTGRRPLAFAYPYGAHDDAVVAAVGRCHSLACTTELRTLGGRDNPLRLPRLDTYYFRAAGMLETYGNARFRQYLSLRRAGRAMRAALVNAGVFA